VLVAVSIETSYPPRSPNFKSSFMFSGSKTKLKKISEREAPDFFAAVVNDARTPKKWLSSRRCS